ncbi:MAG: SGNH/GDSL hydrolase family protein [Gammaproteobacteria bacterium]
MGEPKQSLKTILLHRYYGQIIDKNVGRYIKLRELPPNQTITDRPSVTYLSKLDNSYLIRQPYHMEVDQHGFIKPSDIHVDPDLKIVFLGGSTTECRYMQAEERFPYLVGRALEAKLGKSVNSYNGGVSANESKHSLNILFNKVLPLNPDAVVLMHNINDLVMLRSQGTYDYQNSLKSHIQTSDNLFTHVEIPQVSADWSEADLKSAFRKNLLVFISISRIYEIKPILMTQASRDKEHDVLYHAFNDIIREVALQEKVILVDLAHHIPPEKSYLYDHYHYTARGAQLAAEEITEQLLPLWLTPIKIVS